MADLRWGLLAAGTIASTFARAVHRSRLGRVVAVAARQTGGAQRFAAAHGIERWYDDYTTLIEDPDVDAVYISTPHPMHAEWVERTARAGKHVLCEKPLAMTHAEAFRAAEAARLSNVLLMEAFMFRCHPFVNEVRRVIASGSIGDVRLVRAVFSFSAEFHPESRLFKKALGAGAILDVGCYTTMFSQMVAGWAGGGSFSPPVSVSGSAGFLPNGVDGWASGTLLFSGGLLAEVSCGIAVARAGGLEVYGSKGMLHAPDCWIPAREGGEMELLVRTSGGEERRISVATSEWLYTLEADAFARAVFDGARSVPEVPLLESLENMRTLDRWRAAAGVRYDQDGVPAV